MARNCSNAIELPEASVYLTNIDVANEVLIAVVSVLTFVTVMIFIIETIFILGRRSTWPQPGKTLWLLGLYPVFGFTSLIAIVVPRSANLCSMVATSYLAMSLYVFQRLMVNYFGGQPRALERLSSAEFNLRGPPCCCCFPCLPKVPVTRRSALVIDGLVLQFTVIQPILVYLEAVLIADQRENLAENIPLFITSASSVSSFIALYGLFMFYKVSHQHLAYTSVTAKFVCLKIIVAIEALQNLIIDILVKTRVIQCSGLLSANNNGMRIGRYLLILEAFLVAILAAVYYQRDQDLHIKQEYVDQNYDCRDEISSLSSGVSDLADTVGPTTSQALVSSQKEKSGYGSLST